jgi:hypothetical protein
MKIRTAFLSTAICGVTALAAGPARAYSDCDMGFNDHEGLSLLDPSQAYGFMVPYDGYLWYYNECTSTSEWFYFDEDPATNYGHFHIPAENASVENCFAFTSTYPNGVWGKTNSSGVCIAIDPLAVDRTVISHQPDERLRFIDLSSSLHWRPLYITVLSSSATVRVTYLAANGVTWYYANLTAGYRWYLNPPVGPGTGGVEAWVNVEPGGTGEFDIDDILIDYTSD